MIVELLTALAVGVGGVSTLLALGVRSRLALAAFTVPTGVAIMIAVGSAQAVATLQQWPVVTLVLTVLLPVALLVLRRRGLQRVDAGWAAVVIAATLVLAATFTIVDRINFHVDTFEYLTIGLLLQHGSLIEGVSFFQLEKRQLALAVVHSPAALIGNDFLVSITPLIAAGCVASLIAIAIAATHRLRLPRWAAVAAPVLAATALLSINRVWWNVFYLNGHLLFAMALIVLAGLSWLVASSSTMISSRAATAVQLLMIGTMVVTRPEGSLVAGLALLPTLLDGRRALLERRALLAGLGLSMLLWQTWLAGVTYTIAGEITRSMIGMIAGAIVALAVVPLLGRPWLDRFSGRWLLLVEAVLWLGLAVLAVRERQVLVDSVKATWENVVVGEGGWGPAFAASVLLAAIVVALTRSEHRVHLRFAVTTFVPLVYILAYLRDAAYRVAEADSLNRMIMQVLPLAIAVLVATIGASWRWAPKLAEASSGNGSESAVDGGIPVGSAEPRGPRETLSS